MIINILSQLGHTCWQTIAPYRARLGGAIVALAALGYLIKLCYLSTPQDRSAPQLDTDDQIISRLHNGFNRSVTAQISRKDLQALLDPDKHTSLTEALQRLPPTVRPPSGAPTKSVNLLLKNDLCRDRLALWLAIHPNDLYFRGAGLQFYILCDIIYRSSISRSLLHKQSIQYELIQYCATMHRFATREQNSLKQIVHLQQSSALQTRCSNKASALYHAEGKLTLDNLKKITISHIIEQQLEQDGTSFFRPLLTGAINLPDLLNQHKYAKAPFSYQQLHQVVSEYNASIQRKLSVVIKPKKIN